MAHLMSESLTSNLLEARIGNTTHLSEFMQGEEQLASSAASRGCQRGGWAKTRTCSMYSEDGYIDKDELFFVLDRVGTFKKTKWCLGVA